MKKTIYSSLSCKKLAALLQKHTAATKQDALKLCWKNPVQPDRERAGLAGSWDGARFSGRLYRQFDGQTSGGLALPALSLKVSPAGSISQLEIKTGFAPSLWLILLFLVLVMLWLLLPVFAALPSVSPGSALPPLAWLLVGVIMALLFYGQYQHECTAIEATLKTMAKAFDR